MDPIVFAYHCSMKYDETVDDRLVALGAAIRDARTSRGITQSQLAHMIGQSNGQSYIYRIEAGTSVAIAVIIRIADALDVKARDLIDF